MIGRRTRANSNPNTSPRTRTSPNSNTSRGPRSPQNQQNRLRELLAAQNLMQNRRPGRNITLTTVRDLTQPESQYTNEEFINYLGSQDRFNGANPAHYVLLPITPVRTSDNIIRPYFVHKKYLAKLIGSNRRTNSFPHPLYGRRPLKKAYYRKVLKRIEKLAPG